MRFRFLDFLFSIRSRVGVFALLATLVPSITLGWLSYDRNAAVLRQKAEREIIAASQFAVGEINLWLKERIHDVRIIGSSHLITENLERYAGLGKSGTNSMQRAAIARGIGEYLRSVGARISGYSALQMSTPEGELIVGAAGTARMPGEWLNRLKQNQVVIGEPQWDPAARSVTLRVVIPVRSARGRPLGNLTAILETSVIEEILARFRLDSGEIYVVDSQGRTIRPNPGQGPSDQAAVMPGFATLSATPGTSGEYANYRDEAVVGTLQLVSEAQWGVIVERKRDLVFAPVYELRNTTFVLVAALLAAVGVGAYWIGLTLVYPLDRLVGAADKVASGDLDITLPIARHDELGHLTESFNEMAAQLRRNREELAAANEALVRKNVELEALAITDGLTGLYNRRFLMDVLDREFKQHARSGRIFSLLMTDLDHFKRVNDSHGHMAGDAVLVNAARIFRDEIRSVDYAARFGGEEFTLLLMNSSMEDAKVIAERIRERIASTAVSFEEKTIPVTVSIGIAQVANDKHDTASALIARADAALYAAKHGGRNRVCCDDGKVRQLPPPKATA